MIREWLDWADQLNAKRLSELTVGDAASLAGLVLLVWAAVRLLERLF